MSNITINGKQFSVQGNNITVSNDSVMVDGAVIATGLSGIVQIKFEGDLANLDAHNAKVYGNVTGDVIGHNIECKNVGGNVKGHNVECGDVQGDVKCKNISQ